ncbi:MAG: hypothetical protein Q9162_007380 [Coniocarpon cinnabarinum]
MQIRKNRNILPMILNSDITQEHKLDTTEKERPLLDAHDFVKVLVFQLVVEDGMQSLTIPWKADVLDQPVFRSSKRTIEGTQITASEALPYRTYHPWVVRLGESTGFSQVMTSYNLRRAEGNALNDDPNVSAAVRNLTLDHADSKIFERNYLSRHIRCDTQAVFWGRNAQNSLIHAANSMSRTIDTRRPRKLGEEHIQIVANEPDIQRLAERHTEARAELTQAKRSRNESAIRCCQRKLVLAKADKNKAIQYRRRLLLKRIRGEHDSKVAMDTITQQLSGTQSLSAPKDGAVTISTPYAFDQHARLAHLAKYTCGTNMVPNMDDRLRAIQDMVTLSGLYEVRRPLRQPGRTADKDLSPLANSPANSNRISRCFSSTDMTNIQLKCKPTYRIRNAETRKKMSPRIRRGAGPTALSTPLLRICRNPKCRPHRLVNLNVGEITVALKNREKSSYSTACYRQPEFSKV